MNSACIHTCVCAHRNMCCSASPCACCLPLSEYVRLASRCQVEPKATDFIPAMIDTISKIIGNGHAYALPDGDVYFDVASLPGYGRLSGRSQVRVDVAPVQVWFWRSHCNVLFTWQQRPESALYIATARRATQLNTLVTPTCQQASPAHTMLPAPFVCPCPYPAAPAPSSPG